MHAVIKSLVEFVDLVDLGCQLGEEAKKEKLSEIPIRAHGIRYGREKVPHCWM